MYIDIARQADRRLQDKRANYVIMNALLTKNVLHELVRLAVKLRTAFKCYKLEII